MRDEDVDKFYENYYRDKFLQFGDDPRGVDWKDRESQDLSFRYILNVIRFYYPSLPSFSLFEVGCGYGAFLEFIRERKMHYEIEYSGIDLVEEMITRARTKYPESEKNFYVGDFKSFSPERKFDFVTSSGIFNVKGHIDEAVFENHILNTIDRMFDFCEKGTVFNLMTPSPDYKDAGLFYPSIDVLFSFIYRKLSRKVMIITSHPLWKITVGIFK